MLIAEIGLNHFGDFDRAKELIRAANDSGADLIKSQAFIAQDFIGSMPPEFYRRCEFTLEQYKELIDYARELKNDMFFSIISEGFEGLKTYQKWHKITGQQTREGKATTFYDHENVLISVPTGVDFPFFRKAEILHVTEYVTEVPNLERIRYLQNILGRDVGYSDHAIGIRNCVKAYEVHGCNIIEKHFCLKQHETWGGQMFRDTLHGATPKAFQRLAIVMGEPYESDVHNQ